MTAELADRHAELNRILGEGLLDILFHPIVRTRDHSILGYEALVRGPRKGPLHTPIELFAEAERAGRMVELDLLCQRHAIQAFSRLGLEGRLFINLLSDTLAQTESILEHLQEALRGTQVESRQIVLELTEHQPLPAHEDIIRILQRLRLAGFVLALDDVGGGHNGLRLWHALLPDFIKIDRHFIHGLNSDPARRKFVSGMADLANRLGSQIIAEGVEELSELDWLASFDVPLAQGFLFGVPLAEPRRKIVLSDHQPDQRLARLHHKRSRSLDALVRHCEPLTPDTTVDTAGARFIDNPTERYVPIIDKGEPIGMLWRTSFMNMYARRFAPELHGRKPISQFMDRTIHVGDVRLSLETISRRITQSASEEIAEAFIITREGKYHGVGEVKELLRALTDLQMRNARHANPLTGLPGNVPINDTMQQWLHESYYFVAAYIDLDQFKAFNDTYGYQKGDEAILLLAEALQRHIAPDEHATDYVGHIGGDDFVVLSRHDAWEERLGEVLEDFGQRVASLYSESDRRRGGIMATDRQGVERLIPLMSVSVGVVPCPPGRFTRYHEISSHLADVKKQAKAIPGNSLFIDRRIATTPAEAQDTSLETVG
ncbi:MAG: bifunctional diguanylate cyclase/phosphodiesterase [Pseudomonadota bacterium]